VAKIPGDAPVVTRASVMKSRKRVVMKPYKGRPVVQKWPRPRPANRSELQQAWIDRFSLLACFLKTPDPQEYDTARKWAEGTGWFWRDVLTAAANGNLIVIEGETKVTTPTAMVQRATNVNVVANTYLPIAFETEVWDNNVFWASSPNPTRIVCRSPGLYLCGATILYTADATNANRYAALRVNGTTMLPLGATPKNQNSPVVVDLLLPWYFHQNDYFEVLANSTANCAVDAVTAWVLAITPEAII